MADDQLLAIEGKSRQGYLYSSYNHHLVPLAAAIVENTKLMTHQLEKVAGAAVVVMLCFLGIIKCIIWQVSGDDVWARFFLHYD